MGVPDFVKFIARSSPGALCRLSKGGSSHEPLVFDFILIDATNAAQTLGLEALRAFLNPENVVARTAIIFALDSQRDRSGSARAHRHALVRIGDLDVHVQKLCSQLAGAYRAYQGSAKNLGAGAGANPYILTSGRGVAGEADYKLLDLQRCLVTSAIANGATCLPTFLFISEDSDVLCGALCGPAPQHVSIATKLQDVLFEPSILRLDRVLAFVASCTDAFYVENEKEAAASAAAKMKIAEERRAAKARQSGSRPTASVSIDVQDQEVCEEAQISVEDTAVSTAEKPGAPRSNDVLRRRKQDGPMVATGVRIELTDSSDDDEPEHARAQATTVAAGVMAKTPGSEVKGGSIEDGKCAVGNGAAPTEGELLVSTITLTSCVDIVFLFMMVMGNAVNVPPLVRGATKVDAGSCWQAYCKHKYKNLSPAEAETGRVLLTTAASTTSTDKGSLELNCHFLHSILEAVHYADVEARPPVKEEGNRAIAYLSNAVYATLRYIVGCNLQKTPELQQTFLDSRPLSETAIMLPSLSAVMWVLGQQATLTFSFPLHGLAKRELLVAASQGASAAKEGANSPSRVVLNRSTSSRDAAFSAGDLDVGEHLAEPAASNAWAVRGARTSKVSLETLMQTFTSGVDSKGSASRSGCFTAASATRSIQHLSVTEMLKKSLQIVSPGSLAKANLFLYIMTVWTYALGLGVPRMAMLTKAAASVAKAERGESACISAHPPSSAGAGKGPEMSSDVLPALGHYMYSFELRRMAPVLQASAAQRPSSLTTGSGGSAPPDAASNMASSSSEKSAVHQAILTALGVSYDYSKAPSAPSNVVNLPHSAMDEEDVAELQRLKKVAKKERALAVSVAAVTPAKRFRGDTDERDSMSPYCDKEDNSEGGHNKKLRSTKKDGSKTKKRLGKRERLKQQKASTKVAAVPAYGSAPGSAARERVKASGKTAAS
ncbi:hypothetical protein JKF63_00139 [Porcisia hertigi]|uniref:Uncharacterized protein n=1 Tax=Porcisia hertigi TaxID=2761500 RepID=A0A836HT37_9TRYP|nr:hypothetical protein JKF63_00139 [Porcisia hertigi]